MARGRKTGGRQKGTPNKLTRSVREAYEEVFRSLQQDKKFNLLEWAKNNDTAFYTKLSTKLVPQDVNLTGDLTLRELVVAASKPGSGD